MTNPVPSLPVGAVRLWQWPHDKREFFAPLPDAQRPFLDSIKAPDDAVEYIALPLAAFNELAAKAARAEALATALGEARGSVAKIRAYAIESAAVCREAEEARRSDLSKRENGTIADMLREQTFAWGEKAKSYDALVVFINALLDAAGGKGGGE